MFKSNKPVVPVRRFSIQYVDKLIDRGGYSDLSELANLIGGNPGMREWDVYLRLPAPVFAIIEGICWIGQTLNAGAWTYYEARPAAVQEAMASILREHAPADLAEHYEQGARDWQDSSRIPAVDKWVFANDRKVTAWLGTLAKENRAALLDLTG